MVCLGTSTAGHISVVIRSRNGFREHGVAELTLGVHELKVVIRLSGAPAGASQPAHLHAGGCAGDHKVISSLGSVVNGRRAATLGPRRVRGLSIDVHESTAEGAAVVACGVIPRRH